MLSIPHFNSETDIPDNFTGVCTIGRFETTVHYKNGKYHRHDGPAVCYKTFIVGNRFYLHGKCYSIYTIHQEHDYWNIVKLTRRVKRNA